MSSRRKKLPPDPIEATIESLSHEGRGIAHVDGKTVFIDGALAGETVMFRYARRRSSYAEGFVETVVQASARRIEAKCPHYELCGGCSLQHMQPADQIEHKGKVLLEQLQHIANVEPESILAPLTGPVWGYRRKARLGVKYVFKKDRVLVGFREKRSGYIADIQRCEVLHPNVGESLEGLQQLISKLSIYDQIPQIEVAVGSDTTALVFRHLRELSEQDKQTLHDFQQTSGLSIYLQASGPGSVVPLDATTNTRLSYRLEKYDIENHFLPTDFTQVNFDINESMIEQVIALLSPEPADNILDLFCGLGNFTLVLAKFSAKVTGVEGAQDLVDRAKQNAKYNNIKNVDYHALDLMKDNLDKQYLHGGYNKILLDPPRSGAQEIINQLNLKQIEKIVYVSCNPATLARDAGILVNEKGFKLKQAGVMDMFPHTAHVESIALFERK